MPTTTVLALPSAPWPFTLDWLPPGTHLVGGAVRDALLGRQSPHLDLDFVLPGAAVATARAIAHHYRAGFVVLDAERQIARVVFPRATADFAQQEGPTLAVDLQRRDFTINAIAWNPSTGQIIDPFQGQRDLQRGIIRRIASENLRDDPLRILRAYRQAAQLNLAMDPATQGDLRQLAPHLQRVAAERITMEIKHLLRSPQGPHWLAIAWEDGVLGGWFPQVTSEGLATLSRLTALEASFAGEGEPWSTFQTRLQGDVSFATASDPATSGDSLSWGELAKLLCLVTPISPEAEQTLGHLKYSRAILRGTAIALEALPVLRGGLRSRRSLYEFFQRVGPVFPTVVVLALGQGATWGDLTPPVEHFLDPGDPLAHPQPLLRGQDLIQHLQRSPGPWVGELLAALQLAQVEGEISTPDEAIALAQHLLHQGASPPSTQGGELPPRP